jgi:arginine decarboxylase|tara:strand:+ start:74498 stop:76390 length:1893 start_codon:yes stop_codon:yes gene_type:complete
VKSNWSIQDSEELYGLKKWGKPYFNINDIGHIIVSPQNNKDKALNLFKLVQNLEKRNLNLPLLVHFPDIIEDRIEQLNNCFAKAMVRYSYDGSYQGVFPIKVNQQRHIVESIVNYGYKHKYGLEVGSKPELLIALAQLKNSNSLLICNGYKDKKYVETAVIAYHLGYNILIVVEQLSEIYLVADVVLEHGIKPNLGIRAKLSAKGDSRWADSAGDRAKFGLSVTEIICALDQLRKSEMLTKLKLLHFHIGSQISAIATIKDALSEASQIYVNLCQLGAPMEYFDVGGGLGIDYDGSNTNFPASKNYSMQNYANDVVAAIKTACNNNDIEVPVIVSESGRSVASHQSILIVNVLGIDKIEEFNDTIEIENCHTLVQEILEIYVSINETNFQEAYHDVLQLKQEIESLFSFGYLSLYERGKAEGLFWKCCHKIKNILQKVDLEVDELDNLHQLLLSTYYCNFSVFQSLPDNWSIDQLFPIMPIHRLTERPTELGTLADLTCDSDGKVSRFIGYQNVKPHLELHSWNKNEPYYLGFFLTGAYQEILGSLHNLFGDTNAVHIKLDQNGYHIESIIKGDSVAEVLKYLEYNSRDMIKSMHKKTQNAFKNRQITFKESQLFLKYYKDALYNYTYLK